MVRCETAIEKGWTVPEPKGLELVSVLPRGGYPLLGGAVGTISTYGITFVVNSILVAGTLEVGIVIGSALDAAFCQELQTSFDLLYGLGERLISEGREFF